jgi:uncharacterized protein
MTQIILAIAIGMAFGATLDRIGATNPGFIIRMLNLTNLHLMKTILLGIGVASILTFAGLLAGFVEPGHLSVKAAYIGVFVGGLLLGLGFAVSGYCPGTGLTAAATGRYDAMFFVVGGLLGAAAYMATYEWVTTTSLLDSIAGGKATLGQIGNTKYPALFTAIPGEWLGLFLGFLLVGVAWVLPERIVGERPKQAAAAE